MSGGLTFDCRAVAKRLRRAGSTNEERLAEPVTTDFGNDAPWLPDLALGSRQDPLQEDQNG